MDKTKEKNIIGVVGGMGSYATLHFFEQYLKETPAIKEWDRPRIIIDNNCTMPSRVRAILYKEERPELVRQLTESVQLLINAGVTHIVLTCGTSHVFLDEVFDNIPQAKDKVVHIIDTLAKNMAQNSITESAYIATEGSVISGIYEKYFDLHKIKLTPPSNDDFAVMRELIEDVKCNRITEETCKSFVSLIKRKCEYAKTNNIILGCTEFPSIYDYTAETLNKENIKVWDPLSETLKEILVK